MKTPNNPTRKSLAFSNNTGCVVGLGILGAAIIIGAVILSGAVRDVGNLFGQKAQDANPANIVATLLPQTTPTIVVRPPVIRQVQALADLTTSSVLMSTVVDVNQPRVGNVISERLLLIACGKVTAGVDLNTLNESDIAVSEDGKTVTVRLPKGDIKDVFLIDDATQPCTTKVYDRTNLVVLPANKDLESQARAQAVGAIRETAVQSNVLGEAERNAKIVIERMLLLAGYEKVVFVDK